jgi:hypothetical protein
MLRSPAMRSIAAIPPPAIPRNPLDTLNAQALYYVQHSM